MIRKIAYWGSTAIVAVMLLFALMYLTGTAQVVSGFAKAGYPQHLRIVLGIAKPVAAIVLLLPGLALLKEWAYAGVTSRQLDYQVWCGPAMGAFNEWAKGSFLEAPANRTVVAVALNLLYGAGLHLRREALRQQGVTLPASVLRTEPVELGELHALLG